MTAADPVALAVRKETADRLSAVLEASGFALTRLAPEEAIPSVLRTFGSRLLILEAPAPVPLASLQPYWDELPLDQHLPILLLEPPGGPAFPLEEVDEPLDRVPAQAAPAEVAARASGLLRERTIRIYRRAFHDLSQPLTIARAYSRRALGLVGAGEPARATLEELDRQVERLFRIAEELQKKRME